MRLDADFAQNVLARLNLAILRSVETNRAQIFFAHFHSVFFVVNALILHFEHHHCELVHYLLLTSVHCEPLFDCLVHLLELLDVKTI